MVFLALVCKRKTARRVWGRSLSFANIFGRLRIYIYSYTNFFDFMQFQGKWTGLEFRPTIINGANQVQLQQSILHHTRKDDIDAESDMEIISTTLQ